MQAGLFAAGRTGQCLPAAQSPGGTVCKATILGPFTAAPGRSSIARGGAPSGPARRRVNTRGARSRGPLEADQLAEALQAAPALCRTSAHAHDRNSGLVQYLV